MFLKTLRTFIYKALHRQARQLLLVTSVTIDTWATVSITRAYRVLSSTVIYLYIHNLARVTLLCYRYYFKILGTLLKLMDLCLKLYFFLYL